MLGREKAMIVDPPDGKLPLQPWAGVQKRENEARYIDQNTHFACRACRALCMRRGPTRFFRIPSHITILSEEVHAFRVIATDGRPRIAKTMRLWLGDARGRWEGNTLVVETTNQNGRAFLDRRGTFYTDAATVTERLTMLDQNTIAYGATRGRPARVLPDRSPIGFMLTRHTTKDFEILGRRLLRRQQGRRKCLHSKSGPQELTSGITSEDVPALKARTPTSRQLAARLSLRITRGDADEFQAISPAALFSVQLELTHHAL